MNITAGQHRALIIAIEHAQAALQASPPFRVPGYRDRIAITGMQMDVIARMTEPCRCRNDT
jgi:hypothetical protein